jgi:acyl-CoA synthetase (AMP-forming)/AMP-acid ligase II
MDSTVRGAPLSEERLGALTLGGFLREICEKNRDKEALVFHPPSGPTVRRSYAQVWDEAFAVARALVARGVTKETRVGLLATNRPEWITAMFGISLAGGTCVALSTFAKGAELEYQLRIADVSLLIFERSVLERDFAAEIMEFCPELATAPGTVYSKRLPFLRRAICIGDTSGLGAAVESWSEFVDSDSKAPAAIVEAIEAEVAPSDRAFVFFSSGSTAKPKGVAHSHRAAAIQCWRWPRLFALDSNVRVWTANGFFWSGNFTQAVGATFSSGGCLVLQRFFVPGEALKLMETERVTFPVAWPHQWVKLVEDPVWNKVNLSSLRYVSETSPLRTHPTVKCDWQEPTAAYGNTETLTLSAVHPSGTDSAFAKGNHGLPLPGNTFRIVDPMTGKVLPRGEAGEIAVKGPTLMVGYLRMSLDEVLDDDGFFRTGDGGFFDAEDRLHWQGRLNDIIKTGGANVSPLEIDAVLRKCPGVKIAATVGVPHDTLGEIVVACVVPEDGASLDESAIRAFVSKQLSSYKVPRRVLFVAESDLTMTSSNKVKSGPLRELATRRLAGGG